MNHKEFFAVLKATVREFGRDDIALLSAGLTYYVFFSLFPLLLLGITVAGLLLKPEDAFNFIFTNVAQVAPGSVEFLSGATSKAFENRDNAGLFALIGGVILTVSASSAFSTLSKALNRAWDTEHRPSIIMEKVISFLMMLGTMVALLASALVSAILTSARAFTQARLGQVPGDQIFWQFMTIGASLGLTFVVMLFMFRFVPRTKVLFSDVWVGALLVAVAWTAVKELFTLYLGSSFQNYNAVYGTVGAVIALLTWIYISSLIILAGAEFASETCRLRRLEATRIMEEAAGEPIASPWFSERNDASASEAKKS